MCLIVFFWHCKTFYPTFFFKETIEVHSNMIKKWQQEFLNISLKIKKKLCIMMYFEYHILYFYNLYSMI